MSISDPPVYSPSSDAPSYAAEPANDEERLEFVARSLNRSTPDGTFTKKSRGITIVLADQEDGASTPCYSRSGVVRGEVILDDEKVLAVTVRVEGRQELVIAEGGSTRHELFSETYTLWKKPKSSPNSLCPGILPFRIAFPQTYQDSEMSRRPLPPTFTAQFPGVPGLSAKCTYTLTVKVTKSKIVGWKRKKSVTIPLRFHPRSRPYMPIASGLHPFFSTVKSTPGDWHQVSSTIQTRETSSLTPIDCHLLIPSVQIYAISDTIPFHLQLRGDPSSLKAFLSTSTPPSPHSRKSKFKPRSPYPSPTSMFAVPLPISSSPISSSLSSHSSSDSAPPSPTSPYLSHAFPLPLPHAQPFFTTREFSYPMDPEPSSPTSLAGLPPNFADMGTPKLSIRVYLLRQICARVHGQKAWRNTIIGEGKIRPVDSQPGSESEDSADWEGEVKCNSDVMVGGFHSGTLIVKDFIVLEAKPYLSHLSPFLEHQHAHPIRMVTDSYVDS